MSEVHQYEKEHVALLRKLSPECMVLLKHNNAFPIQEPCEVALYGSGARKTVKGGTGSGDVNVRTYVTIEQGLEKAGFVITTKEWLTAYDEKYRVARKGFVEEIKKKAEEQKIPAVLLGMGAVMPEPEYNLPLTGTGKVAIYVLSRISGEGSDRTLQAGDFKLTETEIRDISYLEKMFERFLLVLNVGGPVDLTPVQNVQNILLLSQLGMTIGDSFADVLLGKSYPSGKLTATWAAGEDYCEIGDFGKKDDTYYKEGIYVGYRYFDTIGKEPMYPFGYGLGYTEFSWKMEEMKVNGSKVELLVNVKNTGNFKGKEVIQTYVSVPEGALDQPYQMLAAYAKTKELEPGENQVIRLEFSIKDLASFSEEKSAEILESGEYVLRIGNSSRNTRVCGVIKIEEEIVVRQLNHVGGKPDFRDWKPAQKIEWSLEPEAEVEDVSVFLINKSDISVEKRKKEAVTEDIKALLEEFTDSELAYLCLGAYEKEGSKSFVGNSALSVAGAAGETTSLFKEKGVRNLVMADGPAGLRLSPQYAVDEYGMYPLGSEVPAAMAEYIDENLLKILGKDKNNNKERSGKIYDQYCSAIPIGTAMAQSWNLELCEECGDIVGKEMEQFGIDLWLAPALNIQRNPLCGRNFEYYSEDPLISGKTAAAITKGVQKHKGRGVTIKHFACNNQETNRFRSNSVVNERALRDIYLKGFEIAVTEAAPVAVMTSYNLLNGEHTSQRRDLIDGILRGEWGFEGLVMSDWVTPGWGSGIQRKYPYACASGSISAGNDIMMPGEAGDYEDLMQALNNENATYPITRKNLEECAGHVIKTIKTLE